MRAQSSTVRVTVAGRGSSGLGCEVSASRGQVEEKGVEATRATVGLPAPGAVAPVVFAPRQLASRPPHRHRPRTVVVVNGAVAVPSASAPLDLCGKWKIRIVIFNLFYCAYCDIYIYIYLSIIINKRGSQPRL